MRTTLTLMFATIGWNSSAFAAPVGTGFSYQGQIKQSGVPVTEMCDFEFTMWDDPVATLVENQVGPTLIFDGGAGNPPPIEVVKGLFSVELDFGSEAFNADARWLEVAVCCSSPCATGFTTMSPRQGVRPAPYALALPAMRVEQNGPDLEAACPDTELFSGPNVIGGWHGNTVAADVQGATIGGGGGTKCTSFLGFSFVVEIPNTVSADFATVGGGQSNAASGNNSTVGGGLNNDAIGDTSTVGGGANNDASDNGSTVGGGQSNDASSHGSTVGGGIGNVASGILATVPGGSSNVAGGTHSFAAGRRAKVREAGTDPGQSGDNDGDEGTFVWADSNDLSDFTSTGPDQFLIRAAGGVGIGTPAPSEQLDVIGNIKASGTVESTLGGFKFPDATIQTTAAANDGHSLDAADGLPVDALFVDNAGNVGIGTNSPATAIFNSKLDVFGGHIALSNDYGVFSVRNGGVGIGAGFDTTTDDQLDLYAGGALRLSVTENGIMFPDGTLQTTAASGGGGGLWSSTTGDNIFKTTAGNVGIGTDTPAYTLQVETSGNRAISATTSSEIGYGVFGHTSAATGSGLGVYGKSGANAGRGVFGFASSSFGVTHGVYGRSDSPQGTAVYGEGRASSGTNYGVYGLTNSPDGYAGYFTGGRNYFEGNVGIGTQTPQTKIHVEGGTGALPSGGGYITLGSSDSLNMGISNNAMQVRNNGVAGDLYLQNHGGDILIGLNGNGFVGIKEVSPQAPLHVGGAARFDGPVTIPATTRHQAYNPHAFALTINALIGQTNGGLRIITGPIGGNTTVIAFARVHLPTGAVITELEGYVENSDSDTTATVRLFRQRFSTGNADVLAEAMSSSASGVTAMTDSSIAGATVDNATYGYSIELSWLPPTSGLMYGVGARIAYQVTDLLP